MRRLLLCSVLVVAVVSAAACGADDAGAPDEGAAATTEPGMSGEGLDGGFVSTQVTGHDMVPGTFISLDFVGDQLSYTAGCNQMGGAFVVEGARLRMDGPGRSTLMGCEPERQAQDEWLSGLLAEGLDHVLVGEQLTLTSGDVTIVLDRGGAPGS